jgi:hypothetical protein
MAKRKKRDAKTAKMRNQTEPVRARNVFGAFLSAGVVVTQLLEGVPKVWSERVWINEGLLLV